MSNLVFPLNIAGAQPNLRRRPVFATGIQTTSSGMELRASWQTFPRYKYTLSIEVMRSDSVYQEFQRVASSFGSMLGQYDTFLIVDPNDSVASNMGFGVTDGSSTAYQLQRTLGGAQQSGFWDPVAYPISTVPRTNLLLQSQTIDNASWTKSSVTVGVNAVVAPDGTLTGDSLIESTTANVQHYIGQPVTVASTVAPYAFSCYAKAGSRGWAVVQLVESTGGTAVNAWFNLTTGVVGTVTAGANWLGVTASITPSNGGWYRIAVIATKANAATSIQCYCITGSADAVNAYAGIVSTTAIYLWGAQIEAGLAATQYLVTLTVPITRTPAYWPAFGDGFEPITEINPGTLQISVAGVPQANGVDVNYNGAGLINFTSAPASGRALTWSGNYFRRVRFASDELELERIFGQLWAGKTVDFISIK